MQIKTPALPKAWSRVASPRWTTVSVEVALVPLGSFIGFVLLSFGSLTWLHAEAMAAGNPIARSLSALFAIFWLLRCVVAAFVFDVRPYLTSPLLRIGNYALTGVFGFLTMVYAWAALKGGGL